MYLANGNECWNVVFVCLVWSWILGIVGLYKNDTIQGNCFWCNSNIKLMKELSARERSAAVVLFDY